MDTSFISINSQIVNCWDISPDGQLLASGGLDGTICFWNIITRTQLNKPVRAHKGQVTSVAFSANGKKLASGGFDNSIILWDVNARQPSERLLTDHRGYVTSLAFSPDGQLLASSSFDGTIILWDTATRQQCRELLTRYRSAADAVIFSSDGKTLISGHGNGFMYFWNSVTYEPYALLDNKDRDGMGIAVSPDSKMMATYGIQNSTVRLWDMVSRRPIGEPLIGHKSAVKWVAFSPDAKTLASSSLDGTIILWDVSLESWLSRACKIANRNLTVAEWRQYIDQDVLSYRLTCPDCPIHPSFTKYGWSLGRNGDMSGAGKIFKRASELDPNFDSKAELQKLAMEVQLKSRSGPIRVKGE